MNRLAVTGVRGEHLAGDLRVTRLVGADQTELIASEERCERIEEEVAGEDQHHAELGDVDSPCLRQQSAEAMGQTTRFWQSRRRGC